MTPIVTRALAQRAPGRPPLSERDFLRQVTALAGLGGWRVFHPWLSVHSAAGVPDLICVKAGQPIVFAELKTAVGKVTPAQQYWLDLLAAVPSVEVYLWRPADWSAIEARFLKRDG